MKYLVNKQDVVDLLMKRSDELIGIYGDIGGACAGAAELVDTFPSFTVGQCKDCVYYCNVLHQGTQFEHGDCDVHDYFYIETDPDNYCGKFKEKK